MLLYFPLAAPGEDIREGKRRREISVYLTVNLITCIIDGLFMESTNF